MLLAMLHRNFKYIFGLLLISAATQVWADNVTPPATLTPVQALGLDQLPDFQSLELENFEPAITAAMQNTNDTIKIALQNTPSWEKTIRPILEQIDRVNNIWNLLLILNNVSHTSATAATLQNITHKFSAFRSDLLHNMDLYHAFTALTTAKDFNKLTATQQFIMRQIVLDYKLSGADLKPEQQQRYNQIITQLRTNTSSMEETLNLRRELATLCGYKNFAAYANAERQPPDPYQAQQFLEDLAAQIKPLAAKEIPQLNNCAQQNADAQQRSKEYLQTNLMLQGMFNLASILFNADLNAVKDAHTWNEDVTLYSIHDVNNNIVAYVYLDLYARAGKNPQNRTLMYTHLLHATKDQLPVAVMSLNLHPDDNGLISHSEVVTLFAEFGSMLQQTLATLDYPSLSGNNSMELDAIIFSKQFMQTWSWQKQYLQDVAVHYKTGNPIPNELLTALVSANNCNSAVELLQQLQIALLDLRIHLDLPEDKDQSVLAIFSDISQQYSVQPALDKQLPMRFQQIFTSNYAATYYTYYFAQTLAADAFAAFVENSIFSAKIGHKFRDTLLKQGGQASILELFKQFRGRDPELKYIITEYISGNYTLSHLDLGRGG